MKKQKIIKTIRKLYRRKEPLNITAVKRSHPELMRAVYAVKPFWGWKQALKDTGINYSKIKVELQEYITCEICGKPKRHLANHVILKHEIKMDEYLMDYPESELVCEAMRANQLQKERPPIPHWEPCWSREYVLDRAAEYYHRRDYPMHCSKFADIDNSLIMAAIRYCGGWNKALITVGLDPRKLTQEAYRQMHIFPDKETVIQGIKQRLKKGLRINPTALQRKQGGKRTQVSLLTSGINFFGSWDNALKAAGVDLEAFHQALKPKRRYVNKHDVIREIRARHKRKWAINHGEIYHGKNCDGQLGMYAYEYFGSWNNALKAAGFDPAKIRRQAIVRNLQYPDKKSVLKAMALRNKKGHYMNYSELERGAHQNFPLVMWATIYFGSWDNALRKIGLDPSKIKKDAYARGVIIRRRRLNMNRGQIKR